MATQKDRYLAEEGDAWFSRNEKALQQSNSRQTLMAERIAIHLNGQSASVLEVGCSRGDNLAALVKIADIRAFGIDPSSSAVQTGLKTFPSFDLRCATADAIPFEPSSMDVVWLAFCMCLFDRELLSACVAEADRVLRDGGMLCISDFDPGYSCRRQNHHAEGLWTYKMDYSQLFLANPTYSLVEKISYNHEAAVGWESDPQDRVAMWTCRKNSKVAYLLR